MNFLKPQIIGFILVIVLFLCIIFASLIRPQQFKNSRLSIFVTVFGSLAVSIIGLNLLVTTFINEEQRKIVTIEKTKNAIDKLWLFPNQLLATNEKIRPEFLKSLYANNKNLQACTIQHENSIKNCQSIMQEQYISIVMIQSWEDFLTVRKLDATGIRVWLCNFLQWAQSKYLKEYFDFLKYNFKYSTILFGEILFEYASQIPIPTNSPEYYEQTIDKILKDEKFQNLLEKTEKDSDF